MTSFSIPVLALSASLLLGGCAAEDEPGETDAALAEAAVDSAEPAQAESALLATLLDATTVEATAEATAVALAAGLTARLEPAGCATSATTGATVTIAFDACTGARGIATIDGTVELQLTAATATSVAFEATATDLVLGATRLDLAVTGTYQTGATTSLAVTSASSAIGPRGTAVELAGAYAAEWDATCAHVDGAWSASAGDAARSLAVDLERCANTCPIGTATRTAAGRTVTVTFDGSTTAVWTSTRAGTGTVALSCVGS